MNRTFTALITSILIVCGCSSGDPEFPDGVPEFYRFTQYNDLRVSVDYHGYFENEETATLRTGVVRLEAMPREDGGEPSILYSDYRYWLWVDRDEDGKRSEGDALLVESSGPLEPLPREFPSAEYEIPKEGLILVRFEFRTANDQAGHWNFQLERVNAAKAVEGFDRVDLGKELDAMIDEGVPSPAPR